MKPYRIAVDFDGTIVEHKYPEIGRPALDAFEWLRRWKEAGALLILWTMRSDSEREGPMLTLAVEFCRKNGVEFDGINEGPGDREWTNSPKVYAHCYVDDAAVGVPFGDGRLSRPTVDWEVVGPIVLSQIERHNARNMVSQEAAQ